MSRFFNWKSGSIIICIGVFVYLLIRLFSVGVTHDEAWTLELYVQSSFKDIIQFIPTDANNHLLNSLLIKCLFLLGSDELWIARMPNLIAGGIFLCLCYKITRDEIGDFLGFSALCMLVLNPFLLDFFSLARGYGLAMSFQLLSLYYLYRFVQLKNNTSVCLSLFLGGLGVLSNFSLLVYWLVLLFIIVCFVIISRKELKIKSISIIIGLNVLFLLAVSYEPLRKLKTSGNLYYGGSDNFIYDTLLSLTKYSFYQREHSSLMLIGLLLFLAFFILIAWFSFRKKFELLSVKTITVLVLLGCVSVVILQFYLFDVLYIINRSALYFLPLLVFSLFLMLKDVSIVTQRISASLLVFLFGINFLVHANHHQTVLWFFDAQTHSFIKRINAKGKARQKGYLIDFAWPYQQAMYYYINHNDYPYVVIYKDFYDRDAVNNKVDYYMYLSESLEKVGYEAKKSRVHSMKKYKRNELKSSKMIIYSFH